MFDLVLHLLLAVDIFLDKLAVQAGSGVETLHQDLGDHSQLQPGVAVEREVPNTAGQSRGCSIPLILIDVYEKYKRTKGCLLKCSLRGTLTTVVKRSSTVVLKGACQWVMVMASSSSWGNPYSQICRCLAMCRIGSKRRLLLQSFY